MLPRLASGWDLVLIARPPIVAASLEQVGSALTSVLGRAGLLSSNDA
jgi:hypothetical protein